MIGWFFLNQVNFGRNGYGQKFWREPRAKGSVQDGKIGGVNFSSWAGFRLGEWGNSTKKLSPYAKFFGRVSEFHYF